MDSATAASTMALARSERSFQRYRASLPWYDIEEVRPATDALWALTATHLERLGLENPPLVLDRQSPCSKLWRSPAFLFGQACGYDALIAFREELRVVATPRYRAPGCQGTCYRSFIVVAERSPHTGLESLAGHRCVYNNLSSHSGRNALRAMVAPLSVEGRFFGMVMETGSHVASLECVQRGLADVAAIDCVTFALLARYRPRAIADCRIIAETPAVPAPPYVAGAAAFDRVGGDLLRLALFAAISDPRASTIRDRLLLGGVEHLPLESYAPIAAMEAKALSYGYLELSPCAARSPSAP